MRIVNLSSPNAEDWNAPQTLIVYTTQAVRETTFDAVRALCPDLEIYGMSSHHGVFSPDGFQRGSLGLLIERGDSIDARPIAVELGDVESARETIRDALMQVKTDETPNHIIMHATMGCEERIIRGIHDVYGEDVYVYGATAAHDKFLQRAFVFHNSTILYNGVILIPVYTDNIYCTVAPGGYLPTQKSGTITGVDGRRILTIDNRRAADVYNEWTDGMFDYYIQSGTPLPRSGALYPLGTPYPVDNQIRLWLSHPKCIHPDSGTIELFSAPELHSPVMLARANAETLIEQSSEIFRSMLSEIPKDEIRAAFIMYCAGCASIVAEKMPDICRRIKNSMGDIPFIGCTTFGEQGHIREYHNDYHGNMMIVAIFIR